MTKANVGNARELTVETACKKMERVKLLVACRQAKEEQEHTKKAAKCKV